MPNTYSLLCYTREATGREEANNEDIAYSMHLALRLGDDDGARWRPLNENYGIFFAAGVPIAAVPEESRRACTAAAQYAADPYEAPQPASEAVGYGAVMPGVDITLKSLKDPFLFRLADGRFGIASTRTARGGEPDGSEKSAFLLAVSHDMTAFDQLGLVTLRTRGGVNRPSVAYDAATACYVVSWTGDDGRPYVAQTHDIEAAAGSNEPLDVARAVGRKKLDMRTIVAFRTPFPAMSSPSPRWRRNGLTSDSVAFATSVRACRRNMLMRRNVGKPQGTRF